MYLLRDALAYTCHICEVKVASSNNLMTILEATWAIRRLMVVLFVCLRMHFCRSVLFFDVDYSSVLSC